MVHKKDSTPAFYSLAEMHATLRCFHCKLFFFSVQICNSVVFYGYRICSFPCNGYNIDDPLVLSSNQRFQSQMWDLISWRTVSCSGLRTCCFSEIITKVWWQSAVVHIGIFTHCYDLVCCCCDLVVCYRNVCFVLCMFSLASPLFALARYGEADIMGREYVAVF